MNQVIGVFIMISRIFDNNPIQKLFFFRSPFGLLEFKTKENNYGKNIYF